MEIKNLRKSRKNTLRTGIIFTLVISLMVLFLGSIPVSAHVPEGAGETEEFVLEPIQIYSQGGDLLEYSIEDLGEMQDGICMCLSGGFRAIQAAISVLYGEDELPAQGELTVVYHHPGSGHKLAFETILTAECVVYEKTGNPQHMTMEHWTYTFTRTDTGEVFETQVKDGVIADGFFDLRYKVNGYANGWHDEKPTEEEHTGFAAAYTDAMNNLLTLPLWELYEGIEEPEEETPAGVIIFGFALLVLIVIGFIYSSKGKRS
jgi:hypothetical protein